MRDFKDITDDEIKYFCKDVFGAFKFDKIKRIFNKYIECIDVSCYGKRTRFIRQNLFTNK